MLSSPVVLSLCLWWLCLQGAAKDAANASLRARPAVTDRVYVVIAVDPAERGPRACPAALSGTLVDLESPVARVRSAARARLARLNWRHLSWVSAEAREGRAERRMALAWVVGRLREQRYAGQPPQPLEPFAR